MKRLLAASAVGAVLIAGANAKGGEEPRVPERNDPAPAQAADLSGWTRPLAPGAARVASATPVKAATPAEIEDEVDVVDAHWMALTMWGEGRNQGEEGMRAVGHVIRNRWLAKRHGAYVTDTVSAAWQFSCWNENDPNRAAMLNIEDLPRNSRDYRLWLAARRISAEILAGESIDPTGGALFYHTTDVQPAWSRGVEPVTQIGRHLFFLSAR
jgi:spore germination cell wall hydrolase CwlJ-like protein